MPNAQVLDQQLTTMAHLTEHIVEEEQTHDGILAISKASIASDNESAEDHLEKVQIISNIDAQ